MLEKKIAILFLVFFSNYTLFAKDSNIISLEKRIVYLEKQVEELKKKSMNTELDRKWGSLKRGEKKIKIKNELGNPDRVGKYSNGDEIWGFKNFTLKFDKNGRLQKWSKPFNE
jgi:hypothetical protein